MNEQERLDEILARVRSGRTTNDDADMLKALIHRAWARGRREEPLRPEDYDDNR